MNKTCDANDLTSMDASTSSVDVLQLENSASTLLNQSQKRKGAKEEATGISKRSRLGDMVFYDRNRPPSAVLHELRPEISSKNYKYELEEIVPKQNRFRCTITIEQDITEPVTAAGVGRSKQLAKNMAAQQALIKLYPTYRPPCDAILTEDSDSQQPTRFNLTHPPSLQNDPASFIDSIRKYLTTKAMAMKTPLQLFNELFVNNQRLNSCAATKNRIQLIDNEENLVLVRVTVMNQHFWGVSAAKSVAQNEACQQAIETLCSVSFRDAKAEFIRALQSMDKITLPIESKTDDNNNQIEDGIRVNSSDDNNTIVSNAMEELSITNELTSIPGVSSSFLIPTDDA